MAHSIFKKMKVTGISVVVPDNIIPIEDELELFDNNPKMLARNKKIIGFGTRYVVPRAKGCSCTTTDLCEAAAKKLIDDMKIDANEIDAIIAVIQKPDYPEPGSACVLHGRLNLPDSCAAFDVNHGCAGYTYGLWIAGSMIESGACKKILLIAGDTNSFGFKIDDTFIFKNDILFGDAGSATMLEYSDNAPPAYFNTYADGKGYEDLIYPFGGLRVRLDKDLLDTVITGKNGAKQPLPAFYMDGWRVFEFTISKVPPSIIDIMNYAGFSADGIDYFVLHQANKQIVDAVAVKSGIPAGKYSSETFTKYGNQSTASMPSVISHLLQDKVTGGKQRLLLSAFGIGLAWCNAIIELDRIYCSGIVVQNFDHIRTREEEIKYWLDKITENINK